MYVTIGGDDISGKLGEPPCSLECKLLTKKDYTDLLWTTVSEFPGKRITPGFIFIERNDSLRVKIGPVLFYGIGLLYFLYNVPQ